MAVIVKLPSDTVQVVPGAEATVAVTIRNTGTVVDQYTIEVLGDSAAWATAEPATISLFPGAEGQVSIRFAPPRLSSTTAGTVVFGVRAASHEDPAGSAVEEGTLAVAEFSDTSAELLPRTSTGSRSATHSLAIDNRGNTAVNAAVAGADADNLVQIVATPPELVVEPGAAAFSRIHVAPRQVFWRGQPKTRPFKLQVDTPGGAPIVLDGTMVQHAVLPSWFGKALLACLAVAIIAALLWFGLLQPSIKSAAQQALADAGITPLPSGAVPATPPAATHTPALVATPTAVATPGVTAAPTPTPTPAPPFAGTPIDGRLTAGTKSSTTTPVAQGTVMYVTDLFFENPDGFTGPAQLTHKGAVIADLAMDNYRDLDFHFVTPIVLKASDSLSFTASCTAGLASAPPTTCNPSVYYTGFTIP